jgi:hypothetical protein
MIPGHKPTIIDRDASVPKPAKRAAIAFVRQVTVSIFSFSFGQATDRGASRSTSFATLDTVYPHQV